MSGQTVCFSATSSVKPFRVNSYIYKCHCLLCAVGGKNFRTWRFNFCKDGSGCISKVKNIFQEACVALKEW